MTQLTDDGSLEDYVQNNFTSLTWQQKTDLLYYIVNDIASIHKIGISHRVIHKRNILMNGDLAFLSDFRFSNYDDESNAFEIDSIYVGPFVTPEAIKKNSFSKSSDIYHLGLIMYYLATGIRPYNDFDNDIVLLIHIARGYPPEFS